MELNIFYAFAAGVLSFLSPCAISLLPGYLGYLMGLNKDEGKEINRKDIMIKAALFVGGFTLVFTLIGLTVTSVGQFVFNNRQILAKVGGVFIVIIGIQTLGLIKLPALKKEKRLVKIDFRNRKLGPFFLGVAFAAGWTPCISAIYSTILVYVSSVYTFTKGVYFLVAYSIGLGVPFLLAALLLTKAQQKFILIKKYSKAINIFSGLLMILVGVLLYTDSLQIFYTLLN